MATEIMLTQSQITLVDEEDFEWLLQHSWCASRCHRNKFVAVRGVVRDGHHKTIYMHREILGLTPGDPRQANHINHDTLDNRRDNLVIITATANKRFQPSRGGSSSFVGVTWDAPRHRWRAQIQIDGKVINLGRFTSESEAARARDEFVLANSTGHELNRAGSGY